MAAFDKSVLVSIIAKNGLDTAETVFQLKSANLKAESDKETDPAKKEALLAESKKLLKLVAALNAAETGLEQYLAETAGL